MSTLFDLTGRVSLVTGGNGGIGRGIAFGLAQAGADLVIVGRNEMKNAAVVEELQRLGRRAIGVQCDVLDSTQIEAAMEATNSEFGRLDILVNNAGVAGGGPAEDIEQEKWDRILGTNLTAMFRICQTAFPLLKSSPHGKIINIGSEYSIFGAGGVVPYSTSKGGVVQLTKSLAIAWAPHGIQVNCIVPGWTRTDMTQGAQKNEHRYTQIVERTPAGRFGEPEDMGGAAVFLASQASDFVTGVVLPVDGGYAVS
ncbi:MAG: 2-deoxy-D-gluconate 3-dehydrogenase [Planctomycetota bacterium]|jgi:2-deoxy-D-gluconate 3-dehydrogenase